MDWYVGILTSIIGGLIVALIVWYVSHSHGKGSDPPPDPQGPGTGRETSDPEEESSETTLRISLRRRKFVNRPSVKDELQLAA